MPDQPSSTYYPQARVSFTVRFEEFAAKDTPEPPAKPPQLRTGKEDPALDVVSRETREGTSVLLLVEKGTSQIGPSSTQPSSLDGRTFTIGGIIPTDATLCRNGIRTADTLKLTVPFADFPFDPRLVRSCGVEFYFGTVRAEDFDRAMSGEEAMSGERLSMLPDFWTDAEGRSRSNLRFQGWADQWGVEFSEGDTEPLVSIECTDQTRLLIDQNAPPKLVVGDKAPLDEAIAAYLSNFPQYHGFAVQYRPQSETRPVLKDAFGVAAYKPTLGPGPNGGTKLTVWDYLTDVCGAVGHVCFVDLVFLPDGSAVPAINVMRPRTFFGARFNGRPGDPFRGRVLPSGREVLERTFTYGDNVSSLSYDRKFTRYDPKNVEVRAYVPRLKKCLVVRYPVEKKDRQKKLVPGDQADQKWEVVPVQGIEDEKTLRVIAQSAYEQMQRSELSAHVHTVNMASLGGGNEDPDILDVQAGDNVVMEIAADYIGACTVVSVEGFEAQNAAGFLTKLGYKKEVAQAYAKAASNLHFTTSFRVKQVTMEWKSNEAPEFDLELVNFIEVKSEGDLPEGEEQQPDAESGATTAPDTQAAAQVQEGLLDDFPVEEPTDFDATS